MRISSFYLVVISLIAGTPVIASAAKSGYEDGAPFILRSNVQQHNAADFDHKYGMSMF